MLLHGENALITVTIIFGLAGAAMVIAGLVVYGRMRVRKAGKVSLWPVVLGTILLLFATGWIGDRLDVGVINSWALMHGAFLIFAPVYFVILYRIAAGSLVSSEARRS